MNDLFLSACVPSGASGFLQVCKPCGMRIQHGLEVSLLTWFEMMAHTEQQGQLRNRLLGGL